MNGTIAWLIFSCTVVAAWMIVNIVQAFRGEVHMDIEPPKHNAPVEVWKAYYAACAAVGKENPES